jgi:hypothetical protein
VPNRIFWLLLAFLSSTLSPVYSGSESQDDMHDDGDDGGADGGGLDILGIPMIYPWLDGYGVREIQQYPAPVDTYTIEDPACIPPVIPPKDKLCSQADDAIDQDYYQPAPIADEELKELSTAQNPPEPTVPVDKYGRKIITLDHGSEDNPHMVRDKRVINAGLFAGVSFIDPNIYFIQYNGGVRFSGTTASFAEQIAENYAQARKIKHLKIPTKPRHFDKWDNGNDMLLKGSMAVALYAGVSAVISDVRAGVRVEGLWTKHITKLTESLIRISFTREGGVGGTGRIQPVPLSKAEGNALKHWEGTQVYTFDRSTKEGRKQLKHALNNRIIINQKTDNDNVTLLTDRSTSLQKISHNLQTGIPFTIRLRASSHRIKMSQQIENKRNKNKTKIARHGHLKQTAVRYVNIPKTQKGKNWEDYPHTSYVHNKISEGSAKVVKNKYTNKVKRSEIRLAVEVSFVRSKVKSKHVDSYNRSIAKRVGINDLDIKTGYKKNKTIGYAAAIYKLNVKTAALNHIIERAMENKHLFDEPASQLFKTYFKDKHDPHSICRGTLTNRRMCIQFIKLNTKRKLDKIAHDLRQLNKEKNIKSKSASSTFLANIARRLRTNQFVLQSFITQLPPNIRGYGTFEIKGEKFLGKKFIVDPDNQRESLGDTHELFERYKTDLIDDEYDMF